MLSFPSVFPAGQPWQPGQSNSAIRFLIGVDGGGTGTRLRLTDRAGRLLGQGEAGPSALGQGVEQAWRHILQALQQAGAQAGGGMPDLSSCAIGLGLAGVGVATQAQAFVGQQPGFAALLLEHDGFTTLLGAHGGQAGAVIAAGTGSVGEALRRDGSRVLAGGWGWQIGDEGSGAWLGQLAMRHTHQALDGRAVLGPLALAVLAQAGLNREALLAWCAAAGQPGYAGLAPLVFDHAASDPVAAQFLDAAVLELERIGRALDPEAQLPLALSGSIALRLAPFFSAATRARCVTPQGDSADGALHLIRQALERQNAP